MKRILQLLCFGLAQKTIFEVCLSSAIESVFEGTVWGFHEVLGWLGKGPFSGDWMRSEAGSEGL